jgi:hypothetical protein
MIGFSMLIFSPASIGSDETYSATDAQILYARLASGHSDTKSVSVEYTRAF